MNPITEAYSQMLVDDAARSILESVPPDFWKPSQQAQDEVRKEIVDKMVKPTTDLNTFHKQFHQEIRDRVAKMARDVEAYKGEGAYQWNPGDHVYSPKTGKTYQIVAHGIGGKRSEPYPVYYYKHGEEGSDNYERGTFIASKAHDNMKKIS